MLAVTQWSRVLDGAEIFCGSRQLRMGKCDLKLHYSVELLGSTAASFGRQQLAMFCTIFRHVSVPDILTSFLATVVSSR